MSHRVLTAAQMQKVDADTIAGGVPGLELMERAGRGVANAILQTFENESGHAAIFVGPGNNGGDGLVVARLLMDEGWTCSIHLLKPGTECTRDTSDNYRRIVDHSRLSVFDARAAHWPEQIADDIRHASVVVDSIFGTGFSGAPRDDAARMIEIINQSDTMRRIPVVSIDIPSGVNGTTGAVEGEAVRADLTLTIGAAKTGLLFHPGRSYTGELHVIDIGFPEKIIEKHSDRVFYLGRKAAREKMTPRPPDIHKYRAGCVLVIAGSKRYRGAAALTAEAALRSGCGMLYLALPEAVRAKVTGQLREVIFISLPETPGGTIANGVHEELESHLARAHAVAIGPGLDRNDETDAFVRDFVINCPKPIVVDADALSAFAGRAGELKKAKAPVIITPHDGELARLTGGVVPTTPFDRLAFARTTAQKLGVTLVHKGAPTLIAGPDGAVWVNGSGSSALAKGGTGDVLTGFIVSFLAQAVAGGRAGRDTAVDAAGVGCYLHGRAAEIKALERGERGVLASDLFMIVGRAMVELESPKHP